MIIRANITSSNISRSTSISYTIIRGIFSALLLILLWSLTSRRRYVIAVTTLEADKIDDKPNRASYYARELLYPPPSPSVPTVPPPIDGSHLTSKFSAEGHESDVEQEQQQVTTEAGMPHQLIYELAIEYKHIPRISLLTCQHGSATRRLREQTRTSINIDMLTILRTLLTGKDIRRYRHRDYQSNSVSVSNSSSSSDYQRLDQDQDQDQLKGVLIKVLRIDLLINGPAMEVADNKKHSGDADSVTLETLLQSEVLRQFVVLDLSCGSASRKVIQMASNKGLFNSSYHWLLIEDYTFNRQADDDDDTDADDDDDDDVDGSGSADEEYEFQQDVITTDATNTSTDTVAIKTLTDSAATSSTSKDNKININGEDDDDDSDDENDNDARNVDSDSNGNSNSNSNNDNANDNGEESNLLIEKFLEKINININTELILAKRINGDQNSKEDYYILYDVWSPGFQYGGKLNITEIGNFSENTGLQMQKWYRQTTTIIRRMNMKNAHIRCMIVVTNKNRMDSLEDYLTQQYDTHLDSMNRFNFALLSHVRDLFNFSLVMSRTPSWGYLKNGTFDGMIGALVRRQADIGGSPIFFRIERARVIDYTTRTWIARPCFIFRHPRTIRTNQIVFLQPFTNDVWVLVVICGSLTIALLAILTNMERKLSEDSHKSSDGKKQRNKNAEFATSNENINQLRSHREAKDAHKIGGERRIDIEGSSSFSNATTLENGRFNTKNGICKRRQVPLDYAGSILNQNHREIDCIDYTRSGAVDRSAKEGFSHTANEINEGTRSRLIKKILKKLFACYSRHLNGRYCGFSTKERLEMLLESLLFYIGSICQQGISFSTNLHSGRCIVIISLFFSFCIYQFYSASIVGFLLMEKPKTIKTLQDITESSLEIGIEDIIYNREFFLRTRDPEAIEFYAKKLSVVPPYADQVYLQAYLQASSPDKHANQKPTTKMAGAHLKSIEAWYNPEHGIAKMKQGGFAFHVDVATAYKIISDTFTEKEVCDLSEIQLFPPQKMVNIVQKGSPLRKIITYGLRRSTEAGLMDYQRKVWHSPKPRCVKQIHTDDLRVDMQTFTSAVFVLIFGFAASVVVLALEMVHNNLWQYFAT